jgi:Trypsin-co-occurring domain 2
MSTDDESSYSLSLKTLIREVHKELLSARIERQERNEQPIFEVESLTLEVHFVAIQSKEAKGGFEFKVLTLGGLNVGGGGSLSEQQVHKVTLNLKSVPYESDFSQLEFADSVAAFRPRESTDDTGD